MGGRPKSYTVIREIILDSNIPKTQIISNLTYSVVLLQLLQKKSWLILILYQVLFLNNNKGIFTIRKNYCNFDVLLAFLASIIFSYLLLLLNHSKNGMSKEGDVMTKKTSQSRTWGENLRSNSFKDTM